MFFHKKTILASCFVVFGLLIGAIPISSFPTAEISNGLIHAKIYLPDAQKGYYRAARFDWSGVIADLTYNGHHYYGEWFTKHNPIIHDAITGPVEDFDPLGYEEAKVGDPFVKIGIGVLAKPDEAHYAIITPYKILDPGVWQIKKHADRITFKQEVKKTKYAYTYQKKVRLVKNKPVLELSHVLKNNGTAVIETEVYNHNFLVLDKQPTGPDFLVEVPFALSLEGQEEGDIAKIEHNQIHFTRKLAPRENVHYRSLKGFGNRADDYCIKVENRRTAAGVRIRGNQPISKLVFWSSSTTVCPEPYIKIKIKPGETFRWKISYEYYTLNASNKAKR